jgi:hypothetical protein
MSIPAGWYPDPNDASMDRFWDGETWTTEQRRQQPPVTPNSGWVAPETGGFPTVTNTELGGLFSDGESPAPRGSAPSANPWSAAPARPTREQENAWWLEADEEEQNTRAVSPTRTPANEYYASTPHVPEEEPGVTPRSRRAGTRAVRSPLRVWLPRVGGAALLVFAVAVAMAEQDRTELPAPPVVDNLDQVTDRPLPPVNSSDAPAVDGEVPNDLFPADPSQTTDPLNPTPAATDTSAIQPTPSVTNSPVATKPATPKKTTPASPQVIPAVQNPGSAFGPNGLLAVSWSKPSMGSTPKGLRYKVEIRSEGVATKVIRTSSTEAIFRGVAETQCSVTITPYTADRTGKAMKIRCGS